MISVEHLTKWYGDFKAVDDLSFEIDEGHVYGFLGPNGAGKSTTMNIITGCLSATSGSVKIDGHDILEEPKEAKKQIGYLPEQPPLYMSETPVEYLRFVAEAKGLKGEAVKKQIQEVIEQTGLEPVKNRRISALSKGYKQRVGIARAIMQEPKLILCDEPIASLDPKASKTIMDHLAQINQTRKITCIVNLHQVDVAMKYSQRILGIAAGKLVFDGTPSELTQEKIHEIYQSNAQDLMLDMQGEAV